MQNADYGKEVDVIFLDFFLLKVLWNKKNVVPLQSINGFFHIKVFGGCSLMNDLMI